MRTERKSGSRGSVSGALSAASRPRCSRHPRRSCWPSASRRFNNAPALTSAGAETTSPVGRTKPIHSRWAAIWGSSLAIVYLGASKVGAGASSPAPRSRRGGLSTESSGATTGPASTMIVGDRAMRILSDSLVEQTSIRRQVGAAASDGAEEIAGSGPVQLVSGHRIRIPGTSAFSMNFPDEGKTASRCSSAFSARALRSVASRQIDHKWHSSSMVSRSGTGRQTCYLHGLLRIR